MFESSIAPVDAAGEPAGSAASRGLLGFVRDLSDFAASGADAAARRALVAPYSGVPAVDARALCVGAGERRTVRDAIERDRVALSRESALCAHDFLRALGTIGAAYRAQGASASEHLATIRFAFALEPRDDAERAALVALGARAGEIDAVRTPGVAFEAADLIRAIDDLARDSVRRSRPRPHADAMPLAARLPEAPANVRRRRGHFSASSLGTYAECRRRWYYRYVCAAVEDRGSSASFYGTAFHAALERFHQEYPRADTAPADLLQRKLDAYLAASFETHRSGFDTEIEYELQRRRAKRTGRRYLRWFLERAAVAPFCVIGTETKVELDLGGYTFIGYIDRLDRDDATGAVSVIDYKTGSIPENAREYRAKVAKYLDFQLPFYYWARTAAGDRVTKLALVPLKDASLDVRPVELEVAAAGALPSYSDAATGTIGLGELERARAKMIELAATLGDGVIEWFPPASDAETCTYCSYKLACRERPRVREERFGR